MRVTHADRLGGSTRAQIDSNKIVAHLARRITQTRGCPRPKTTTRTISPALDRVVVEQRAGVRLSR
jgi:hypothetical protein